MKGKALEITNLKDKESGFRWFTFFENKRKNTNLITSPHTGISRESHPSSTVCPHTPAPPFPHTKSLPFHKSQLPSPAHNPMISLTVYTGPFRSSKTEQIWQLYGVKPAFQRCCQFRIRFSSYSFFITTTTV